MSFDALAWAAKQATGSSGTKLVLLGLAECASRGHGLAFPSIAELVEFSSLNRKSVIANLDRLAADGFIEDTGRKVGRTAQIKVYRLLLETEPKTEQSPKRNSSDNSGNGPKNGTRNLSEPVSTGDKSPLQQFVDSWGVMAKKHGLPEVRVMDNSRKQQFRLREKAIGLELLLEAVEIVGRSEWLRGDTRTGSWRPTIDFILQPESLRKVLEGAYGGVEGKKADPVKMDWEAQAKFFEGINRPDDASDCRRRGAQAAALIQRAAQGMAA